MTSETASEALPSADAEPLTNVRWERTEESADFFIDEDQLRRIFYFLLASGIVLLVALASGLWRLSHAAFTPPRFVGISHGQIFTGQPQSLATVRDSDFDQQLSDTVEVLFSRTEKGLPPAIHEFCATEVVKQIDQAYQDQPVKYPAGYVQTMTVLESRVVESRSGFRHVRYAGRLSSRSASAAQTSTIFLDCTFVIRNPTPLNTAGWRLIRVDAMSREAFYEPDREKQVRRTLNLPPTPSKPTNEPSDAKTKRP